MNRLDLRDAEGDLRRRLPRPSLGGEPPVDAVRSILAEVAARGDAALAELTARFDGVVPASLRVPESEIVAARSAVPAAVWDALARAAAGIRHFQEAQLGGDHRYVRDGIHIESRKIPVDRAGCYVPGGLARYPSTVLMTAVVAKVAGVEQVALCVPPGPDGHVPALTLAAAAIAGVDEVYAVGGAQAIAAMAYGTETIPAVDVIVGPGNAYVAVAKREVAGEGRVGVPSAFTGPSEIVVVADATVPPAFAAVDVLVQAEHGPGGLAWLITWDEAVADAVESEVARLASIAPRRAEIEATLRDGGWIALVRSREQAIEVANLVAPEHLELLCDDPASLVPLVRHAGAVFCGPWAAASIGDYVAGPSHVLPTFGSARFGSALTVDDFRRDVHVVTLDADAFDALATTVETLAVAEGLDAHAESIRQRRGTRERGA